MQKSFSAFDFCIKDSKAKMDLSVLLKLVTCIDKVIWTRFTAYEY